MMEFRFSRLAFLPLLRRILDNRLSNFNDTGLLLLTHTMVFIFQDALCPVIQDKSFAYPLSVSYDLQLCPSELVTGGVAWLPDILFRVPGKFV